MYIPEKNTGSRAEKVKKELHRFISEKLITGHFFTGMKKKPMISVTRVNLTPNMREAFIYFDTFDQSDTQEILTFLRGIAKALSKEWAKISTAKYSPSFEFHIDLDAVETQRLETIFQKIKK